MVQIKEGLRIIVEVTRWVNKSIGRAEIDIINADDFDKDVPISHSEYIFFKGIEDLFELFPWAAFQIDEDYYDGEKEDAYRYDNGIWDPEDQVYYFQDQTYEEYKRNAPEIRRLPDSTGELETYRLEMSLNTVGKSFLEIEGYLNNNE